MWGNCGGTPSQAAGALGGEALGPISESLLPDVFFNCIRLFTVFLVLLANSRPLLVGYLLSKHIPPGLVIDSVMQA